jgi:hypothetical protein
VKASKVRWNRWVIRNNENLCYHKEVNIFFAIFFKNIYENLCQQTKQERNGGTLSTPPRWGEAKMDYQVSVDDDKQVDRRK